MVYPGIKNIAAAEGEAQGGAGEPRVQSLADNSSFKGVEFVALQPALPVETTGTPSRPLRTVASSLAPAFRLSVAQLRQRWAAEAADLFNLPAVGPLADDAALLALLTQLAGSPGPVAAQQLVPSTDSSGSFLSPPRSAPAALQHPAATGGVAAHVRLEGAAEEPWVHPGP
ncbi:hypothetical protein HaLaN_08423 [Haematococcus lacustris]|uniref:Uncharacterized protein n=1 Tax=Haematococcus lacustris TaxID=44745 RepID=A0A699YSX8_HAELA|nr:hypothetical protein HaLaN_08423 [Haematococcus lacustris]